MEKFQAENNAKSMACQRKAEVDKRYFKKGILTALASAINYGLYTAFLTTATVYGVWAYWSSGEAGLSAMAVAFILGTLATGFNDGLSAIWAIIISGFKGKLGDVFKVLRTKPGLIMVVAAIVGGPLAGVAYILAIQMGGPVVIPLAGLNAVVGAILGSVIFKQKLSLRMIIGMLICVAASLIIGLTSVTGSPKEGIVLGMILAIAAAFGWGFEGCIAGFGTTMIDSEIGITIRQIVSSLANFLVVLPILCTIEGSGVGLLGSLFTKAVTDPTILLLAISGFFSFFTFSMWYKGNSMCGAALGMACNGTYTFWGPLFCWIILGIILNKEGYDLPPVAWLASLLMAFGIFVMSVNPLDYLKKGKR